MDIAAMLSKIIEYAPAVAVLLVLQWRHERRLDRFFRDCLDHLLADAAHDRERGDI